MTKEEIYEPTVSTIEIEFEFGTYGRKVGGGEKWKNQPQSAFTQIRLVVYFHAAECSFRPDVGE